MLNIKKLFRFHRSKRKNIKVTQKNRKPSRLKKIFIFNSLNITKRQKFAIIVVFLSLGLFFSEHLLGKSGVFLLFFMAFLTDLFLYLILREDLKGNFAWHLLILPFLYSSSFGLFYFLVPARFITRIAATSIYAIGLYSLFLSQNIFIVASIRTIALLSSARIVSFVITVVSYFFLANIVLSMHLFIVQSDVLIFIFSFLLAIHSIWTYTLDKNFIDQYRWAFGLSVCLLEASLMLWFWPSNPTFIALFLTGFFYTIVGLAHVWLDKRLFKNVLWEYVWVAVIVLFILILSTTWG